MYHHKRGRLTWLREQHLKWVAKKPTLSVGDAGDAHFTYKRECALLVDLAVLQKLDTTIGRERKNNSAISCKSHYTWFLMPVSNEEKSMQILLL